MLLGFNTRISAFQWAIDLAALTLRLRIDNVSVRAQYLAEHGDKGTWTIINIAKLGSRDCVAVVKHLKRPMQIELLMPGAELHFGLGPEQQYPSTVAVARRRST